MALPMAPPPKSPLGRYRLLSPTASLRVSPLCLGGMNFGEAWNNTLGSCDKSMAFEIMDYFYEQGGNFIDTSNNYQFGQSEYWIGEWMKKRGVRDEMIVSTKYTTNFRGGKGNKQIMANFTGTGSKSLRTSVDSSLRRLQTYYIDLLYVHWWDFSTSIEELMQSLNNLVVTGKILHLGASDMPAFIVARANEYARNHGLRQFSVYQGRYNAACRDMEREIIPMMRYENMSICVWGALGGGAFKNEEQRRADRGRPAVTFTDKAIKVSQVLEAVAQRHNTILTNVALAYTMNKFPYMFPVIGGRTREHLEQNIEALTLKLSDSEIQEIEDAVPFEFGFPGDFYWNGKTPDNPADVWLLGMGGTMDNVPLPKPIEPAARSE
ncbi:norsolorinic acid reductase [Zalerion maritima]|uniref:Norsolorinic acid reductase n=1 Tax=Zalerion maritima TaxID=339359 RepID=A0AAD5RW08_9PEZI|nr:norsolorinic acid reductase [Zalerion maritima]